MWSNGNRAQERKGGRVWDRVEAGEGEGVGGHEGPQRCPGTPGTCCLSLTLTHFPAQMKGFVLLHSAALISQPHISSSSSKQFTLMLRFFFWRGGALHLVQRRKRYLAIWRFGGVCCESERINCERRTLGERCVWFARSAVDEGFV